MPGCKADLKYSITNRESGIKRGCWAFAKPATTDDIFEMMRRWRSTERKSLVML